MKTNAPDEINRFIIDAVLVSPINSIIIKLENRDFRDCDIKWLNSKLEHLTKFACETLNETVVIPSQTPLETNTILNECAYNTYLKYFKTLLSYFKNF